MRRVGFACAALFAADPAHGGSQPRRAVGADTPRPELIGTACIRMKPALRHVLLSTSMQFCCGPNGWCAVPLASTVLAVPAMPGHT